MVTFTFLACTMNSGHPSSAQPWANRWKVLFESYYNIQLSKFYIDNWTSPTYFTFWLWRDWTETLSLHVSSTSRLRVGGSGCNATIFPWFRCDELWSSLEWKWGNGGRKQTVVHGIKLQTTSLIVDRRLSVRQTKSIWPEWQCVMGHFLLACDCFCILELSLPRFGHVQLGLVRPERHFVADASAAVAVAVAGGGDCGCGRGCCLLLWLLWLFVQFWWCGCPLEIAWPSA